MWFVLLAIALTIVALGGLYFRRRFLQALQALGVATRTQRVAGLVVPYLLFGYPIFVFLFIGASLILGRQSVSLEAGFLVTWLAVLPFWISVLVMLQSLPFLLLADLISFIARKRSDAQRRMRYRSVAFLLMVAVLAIYTPARIMAERKTLDVNRYDLGSGQGKPFTIAFVGDLQRDQHTDAERTQQVIDMVNAEEPDVVLFAGDWINTGSDFVAVVAQEAARLKSRLGTFSVRGDHEHFAYRDQDQSVKEVSAALEKQGVQMPDNEVRWFEHEGKRIGVIFLTNNYIVRSESSVVRQLLQEVQGADYSILMTHQFSASMATLVDGRVDLVLAGHTHGGQVNPLLGLVHVSIARVETPYVEGRYVLSGGTTVIVTAGIGFSIAPFRYASPASFEILSLRL
jgi:hypothetical protein